MAFSALSMSYRNGVPNLDALQHYQQALPTLQSSLRTEQDLTSDGVFLTHFILLLYEIAAGEPRGLSLWSQHIGQLLRITLLRREMYGHEPYSFIVWWVANIDIHVVLSGMGNGEYIETMLRNNMLASGMDPQNPYHTYDYNSPSRGLASQNGHEALPSALAFHRRISILAAELGLLARDIRAEEKQNPDDRSHAVTQSRQERIGVLQDTLRRTWNVQMTVAVASGYGNQVLPVGARGIFEHSFALYRACLIYSHTSMYSAQRLLSPSALIHEVSQSGGEILRLAREIVSHNHLERKFIVFPLFMSGFVSKTQDERVEILALVKKMEEDSVGRNILAVRQLLEIVYERQERRREELRREGADGGREDVDWVSMIGELGLQVVSCRL
ncbi:MAG: hypothetical protein ALECFALPRED_005580 [Alectoria fallacina]|uniref:Uncharacterized protein n=1 Tax=Alectoria fallacina TaxID=1903189 RepID=A0A8H3ITX3_9LECA|nr:MAG: hypothetical protein ALECFALPRED_005580 [Alectoria fallacina]